MEWESFPSWTRAIAVIYMNLRSSDTLIPMKQSYQ